MSQIPIKENEFFPAPSGTSGAVGYQTGYGTYSSPEISQNSNNFQHNDNNKAVNQNDNTRNSSLNDTGSMEKDVNFIYSKKNSPSVDSVVAGLKYEMGQQIKKDKHIAKQTVLNNLKKDPRYYSDLHMLNISDQDMVNNMQENKIREAINQTRKEFDILKRMKI